MFSINHIIWLMISIAITISGILLLNKYKPSLKSVLTVCCCVCVASEFIKMFGSLDMVPSSNGKIMYVYMKPQHLPFHLCSMQIFMIFYARFAKESNFKETLLAFMYPSCLLGAAFALAIPSIFKATVKVSEAFVNPVAYQYFIYHSMLIILGAYIALSKQVHIRAKNYLTSLAIIGVLGIGSIYMNSIFSAATYANGKLVSVDYTANFLFTYKVPINIKLTEIWHWYIYLGVLAFLVVTLVAICYIPYFVRDWKAYKLSKENK